MEIYPGILKFLSLSKLGTNESIFLNMKKMNFRLVSPYKYVYNNDYLYIYTLTIGLEELININSNACTAVGNGE